MSADARLERRWRRRLHVSSTSPPPHCLHVDDDDDQHHDHNGNLLEPQRTTDNGNVLEPQRTTDNGNVLEDNDLVDPDYKLFLDNLRQHGKAYVLELAGLVVHYEEETTLHEQQERVKEEEKHVHCADHTVMVDKDYAKFLRLVEDGEPVMRQDDDDVDNRAEEAVNYNVDGEDQVVVDKDYAKFLDWIEEREEVECDVVNGENFENGGLADDEMNMDSNCEIGGLGDDEMKVDEDVNVERKSVEDGDKDADVDDDESSCYIVEQDGHSDSLIDVDSGATIGKTSEYRKKLMEVLKQPYDEKEYLALKREIYVKKRVERHRESRNNSLKPCPINRLGNSYLDTYPDVERRIQEAPHDKSRNLKVMRGFFYWLKYLTQDGAFRPWLDTSCL